jgi:hypothetical protein
MPVQQTIDVGQRHAAREELFQLGAQLRGSENLAAEGRNRHASKVAG